MKLVYTLSLALVFAAATALPAFAQPAPQAATATKTFNLTLHGDVPAGESFGIEYSVKGGRETAPLLFCGPDVGTVCTGSGTVHTQSVSVPQESQLFYRFYRGHVFSPNFEEISSGEEAMIADSASNAAYTFASTPSATPAPSATPSANPSPSAPVPSDLVTLTLNLTINGEVPPGAGFSLIYGEYATDFRAGDTLCGTVVKGTRPDCIGDGAVYTDQIAVPRGITFAYIYYVATSSASVGQPFNEGVVLMDGDKTIDAVYTFSPAASPSPSTPPPTGKVTVTFNLTVNGDVPGDAGLQVSFGSEDARNGYLFCGISGQVKPEVGPPCTGNGTAYSTSVQVERGYPLYFSYLASGTGTGPTSIFYNSNEVVDADKTYNAVYAFAAAPGATPAPSATSSASPTPSATAKPSAGTSATPSASAAPLAAQLPDTGVGVLPIGGAVAAALALFGGGFAVRRRW